jgi:hypothetical protein
MLVTRTRLIYGDVILLIALGLLYFATAHFTQNVLAMVLVIMLFLARSIFFHVNYYKTNGKLY